MQTQHKLWTHVRETPYIKANVSLLIYVFIMIRNKDTDVRNQQMTVVYFSY